MNLPGIDIRLLTSLEEFIRCVDLQRRLWGCPERELVPSEMFVVAGMVGGHTLGAFAGNELVGFDLASPGLRDGTVFLCSHLTAVEPRWEERSLRRQLKLAQRERALADGFDLIEWTFDPLKLLEARTYIAELGAVGRQFLRDLYGRRSCPPSGDLRSDSLEVEWHLRDPRLASRLRQPVEASLAVRRIHVPATIDRLRREDPTSAEAAQARLSRQFEDSFRQGYTVTGFELGEDGGTYLLEGPTQGTSAG